MENHVRAVARVGDENPPLLISGPRQGGLSAQTLKATRQVVVKDFDYDPANVPVGQAKPRADAIAERVIDCLRRFDLNPDATVLHWHNHSLGKNTAAPGVIRRLASCGYRQLLQIHDFAEDNRPGNYAALIRAIGATTPEELDRYLYPVAAQIHYATLTHADAAVLSRLGIEDSQTHCLPNSVISVAADELDSQECLTLVQRSFGLAADARWCLYPVRGIRRKNLGEFLLLTRWLVPGMYSGMTLRPTTPVEAESYDRWKCLAETVAPNAVFDAAHHPDVSYAQNLSASDFVLSTSVAEGFGMAFLEPWLARRGVVARNIPTVTRDFVASGIRFNANYGHIPIPGPTRWLRDARDQYRTAGLDAWRQVPERFRPPPPANEDHLDADAIDFAMLTPGLQQRVLERAARDAAFEREIQQRSANLIKHLRGNFDAAEIQHNAGIVSEVYSAARQGEVLRSLYREVLGSPATREIDVPADGVRAIGLIAAVRPAYPCRTESFLNDGRDTMD